jgi:hypothetical protein
VATNTANNNQEKKIYIGITELHGQTDLRLEIMKYILNVTNIFVYINSASNNLLLN